MKQQIRSSILYHKYILYTLPLNTLSLIIFMYYLALPLYVCHSPRLERVFDLSMIAFLLILGLLARDRSAVTRVIEILPKK